ncbi:maleylpyruvate isomerase N-terminal domain-containing protein [Nocardioides panacis]|uniref:Maleylpyruvate isomerase N-terminal domain-containing protein n=1 Tax=Nocardioides panacis TaxID=2849501 RepID=A0A975SWG1_9ACTN|nr:maleylpyruvate isomerase N-terminal domain-containing protein [Nocardioides panacis]QWZ06603.1 maleylpyruvate isomerase N-terminal domain-containing protein [Nocardioides panacis]
MSDLVDDLEGTVAAACTALRTAEALDWDRPATGLTWTVRSTVEHVADDLFAYAGQIATATPELEEYVPFAYSADRPGEAEVTTHARREAGNEGVVRVLDACGGMLVALARTRPADVRGYHPYGVSDPPGFAAMGTVETLLHLHDVADPLDLSWHPDPSVVRRVLDRLFPDAPTDDPWPTLLRLTGRDPAVPLDYWRWDGTVRRSS